MRRTRINGDGDKYFVCGVLKNNGLLTGYTHGSCPMHAVRMLCAARGFTVDQLESWSAHNLMMFEKAEVEIPEYPQRVPDDR